MRVYIRPRFTPVGLELRQFLDRLGIKAKWPDVAFMDYRHVILGLSSTLRKLKITRWKE